MKQLLILLILISSVSCKLLGGTEQDDDFIAAPPTDGLLVWLDASNYHTLENDGVNPDYLLNWNDLSPYRKTYNCSATLPTINTYEINGLNAVYFHSSTSNCNADYTGDSLGASDYTFLAAIQTATITGIHDIFNATSLSFRINFDTPALIWSDGGDETSGTLSGITPNQPIVVAFTLTASTTSMRLNGEEVYNAGVYGPVSIATMAYIGSPELGLLGELFLYNRELSPPELHFLEDYLMEKWGI